MAALKLKRFFKKYIVDALSHMAFGLFCSLILGLIIGQIAKIPGLDVLQFIADALSAKSPLVGACIGLAIAYGLECAPLVIISSAVAGALSYEFGGPVGAYISVIIASENWFIFSSALTFNSLIFGSPISDRSNPNSFLVKNSLGFL